MIKVEDAKEMAKICAELTRQGIAFECSKNNKEIWIIRLTGF